MLNFNALVRRSIEWMPLLLAIICALTVTSLVIAFVWPWAITVTYLLLAPTGVLVLYVNQLPRLVEVYGLGADQ